jgi:hypothetical protein
MSDGRPCSLPTLILTPGARRVAFSPDGQYLVVLRGDFDHKNFWLIDLRPGGDIEGSDNELRRQLGEYVLAHGAGTLIPIPSNQPADVGFGLPPVS